MRPLCRRLERGRQRHPVPHADPLPGAGRHPGYRLPRDLSSCLTSFASLTARSAPSGLRLRRSRASTGLEASQAYSAASTRSSSPSSHRVRRVRTASSADVTGTPARNGPVGRRAGGTKGPCFRQPSHPTTRQLYCLRGQRPTQRNEPDFTPVSNVTTSGP